MRDIGGDATNDRFVELLLDKSIAQHMLYGSTLRLLFDPRIACSSQLHHFATVFIISFRSSFRAKTLTSINYLELSDSLIETMLTGIKHAELSYR